MRALLCGLLLAAGCSKPSPTTVDIARGGWPEPKVGAPDADAAKPAPTPKDGTPQVSPAGQLPQTLKQRHQGRTAEEWGKDLLDSAEDVSHRASFALNAIGAEALRFVYAGFDSEYPHVRFRAVSLAINYDAASKYPDVFLPALVLRLADTAPGIRGEAALTIARCKFRAGEAAVREAMEKETVPDPKRQMGEALKTLTAR